MSSIFEVANQWWSASLCLLLSKHELLMW
jgi:hypothetical protein